MYSKLFHISILLCLWVALSTSEVHDLHQHVEIKKPIIPILKHTYEQDKEGYKFSYETGNGIHAQESGYIKNKGDEKKEILVQQGTITYHDEHGHPISLTYIADENGFQPQGAHLPTSPSSHQNVGKLVVEHPDEYEKARLTYLRQSEGKGYEQ